MSLKFLNNATFAGDVSLADSKKLILGAGSDLQIYHNNSNDRGYIYNATGNLYIENDATDGDILFYSDDGSGGTAQYFRVDGSLVETGFLKTTHHYDNVKATFGDSNDLQIYHDGSNSYIKDTGTGTLNLQGSTQVLINGINGQVGVQYIEGGKVGLRHANVERLATTNTGVTVTGGWVTNGVSVATANVEHTDNVKSLFGNGNDLEIYHNGSNSYINQTGTGKLILDTASTGINIQSGTGETRFTKSGANSEIKVDDASQVNKVVLKSSGNSYLNGGNVGIGTTSPVYKLDVSDEIRIAGGLYMIAQAGNLYATDGALSYYSASNGVYLNGAGANGWLRLNGSGAENDRNSINIYGSAGDYMNFRTANSTRMLINSTGNVGIGTTSPSKKLHVVESGTNNTAIFENSGQTYSYAAIKVAEALNNKAVLSFAVGDALASTDIQAEIAGVVVNDGGVLKGDLTFKTNVGDNVQERMRIDSSGLIKFSKTATTATAVASINHASNDFLYINGGTAGTAIGDDNQSTRIVFYNNDYIRFDAAGSSNVMRITSAGNVGIGTTSPQDLLEVRAADGVTGVIRVQGGKNTVTSIGEVNSRLDFGSNDGSVASPFVGGRIASVTELANGARTGLAFSTYLQSRPGDDLMEFVRITSEGNVGIGTTSPNQDGFGSSATVLSIKAKTQGGSANTELIGLGNNDNDQVGMLGFMSQSATSPLATIRALRHTSDTSGKLTFDTAGSEKMRIDSSGNVGIGTSSPNQKLQVGGNLHVYDEEGDTDASIFISTGTSNVTTVKIASNGNSFFNAGNVGIGTTSPTHKLTVNAPNDTTAVGIDFPSAHFDFAANSTSGYTTLFKMDNTGLDIGHDSDGRALNLKTGNLDRVTILGNGNVGIGDTSPTIISANTFSLSVNSARTDLSGGLITKANGTVKHQQYWDSTGYNFSLSANSGNFKFTGGNVGIGTTSPLALLDVVGEGTAIGSTGYYYNARFKDSDNVGVLIGHDSTSNGNGMIAGINKLAFLTYGTSWGERMVISSGGAIKFNAYDGTNNTGSPTHILGTDANGNVVKSTAGSSIGPWLPLTAGSSEILTGDLAMNNNIGIITKDSSGAFRDILKLNSSNVLEIGSSALSTNIIFKNSGNVGIGTDSPNEKLHAAGNIHAYAAGGIDAALFASTSAGSTTIAVRSNGITHFNGGNVGIGTTSPGAKLDVAGDVTATANYTSGNSAIIYKAQRSGGAVAGDWSYDDATTDMSLGTSTAHSFSLKTGNTRALTLNSSQNATFAGSVLVNGTNVTVANATNPYVYLNDTNAGAAIFQQEGNTTRIGSDSNTQVALVQNNATAVTIDTGKNVGIGTTSPTARLDILTSSATGDNDIDRFVRFRADNGEQRFAFSVGRSGNNSALQMYDSSEAQKVNIASGGNSYFNGGNVGIGTDSPGDKLEISGVANYTGLTIKGIGASRPALTFKNVSQSLLGAIYGTEGRAIVFESGGDGTTGVTAMTIDSLGKVGIGTTSPGAKLNVTGSYGDIIKAVSGSQSITTSFVAPSTGSGLNNIISTAGEFNIGTSDAQPFSLATSSISRVSILSGGNVGIGTTSPGYKLEVVGNANITSTSGTTLKIEAKNPTAFNDPKIEFVTWNEASGSSSGKIQLTSGAFNNNDMAFFTEGNNSVTEKMRIRSGGNVGIGITSPQAKLNVNGGIKIEGTSSLSFGGSSSVPAWAINSSGNDLIIDDQATTSGSVLFNNNEGVALPRLTTTQINAISSPTQGLMAYNTTLNTICFYNGSSWQKVSHASM